jgi:tetratricopeptide (TPR) repeat protein
MASGRVSAQPTEEQGPTDWPEVISKLRQEVYERPGHAQTRQQLAIAYNNYGVSLGQKGQWKLAAQQLEEAVRLDGTNQQFRNNLSNVHLNQAHEAYQHHQVSEAIEALDQAIALNPSLAQAYILRGEIEYGRQRLKEAKAAWQRAIELDPTQQELAQRLQQVTQELPVESNFERLSQAYFDLRYEEQLERPMGFDIRDALLEARRSVGSDFAYWPTHKLVVLLYSAESFHALRQQTPDWIAGQFDGKIRVPFPNAQLPQSTVKQILFHEYTHAIIHDLTNGNCPTWLNEGLAEYEGRKQMAFPLLQLANAHSSGRLVPWARLSDQFSFALPADEVVLGYQQSYGIVHHLVTRYGFWRIRRLLKAIADGQPWEAALTAEFRITLPKLEANWRDQLPELLSTAP